ncbi:hypothetical protein [Streptomyces sp. NPDC020965]|uniref:hypothetical protein n=1 Tax=Streptomyces sp. NPDC020965 TaxID=3365105 RepID=UPI00378A3F62
MFILTLADEPEPLPLTDRPTGDEFDPLPYGLTLAQAVAVRACDVKAGDLVVAEFDDMSGARRSLHIPGPYRAAPSALRDCPCNGCAECDDMDSWTFAEPSRVADTAWRFVCLSPAEDGEPCAIVLAYRPVAVIPAAVVTRVEGDR